MNDELLGAYLDDELDAAARAEVERAVGENAGVALRLKRLQQADSVLRQAMAVGPAYPDAALSRRILDQAPAGVRPLWKKVARRWAPLAAACVLGLLLGRFASPAGVDAGIASLAVDAALARALDQTPSGATAAVMGGEADMELSFAAEDGTMCRQFRLISVRGASDALACRDDGEWRLRAQAALGAGGVGGYRTAGAQARSAIDIAVEAMGAVMVLDEAEEAAAIEAGWRSQ